jgi:soluble lytic murein transglycosylase-like protein
MRDRRIRISVLAVLAWLSLSAGGVSPGLQPLGAGLERAPAPWTPEVPGIEAALRELGTSLRPSELGPLARTIAFEARQAGFSSQFVLAVIRIESGADHLAVSPKGALGLMQLQPETGEAVAGAIGLRWEGSATLFDPVANVRLGVAYLERLRRRYGSLTTALAAYNWGPTRVSSLLRRNQPIPVAYSRRVLRACGGRATASERPI